MCKNNSFQTVSVPMGMFPLFLGPRSPAPVGSLGPKWENNKLFVLCHMRGNSQNNEILYDES